MPGLALSACLVLIAWFLARDIQRRKSVSVALWMPTLLVMVLASRPFSLWLSGGVPAGGGEAEGTAIDRLFYVLLIVGSAVVASSRGVRWNKVMAANTAIMFFYLYLALSVLWSEDPAGSFKRWFKVFGNLFVVCIILSERDPLEALRAVYVRSACVLIPLSVVFIRYFPKWGRSYSIGGEAMYTGVTMQKNSLGEMVMTFTLFLLWDYLEARRPGGRRAAKPVPWDSILLLLMGFWLLYISASKTALLCMVTGGALILRGPRFATPLINRLVLASAISVPALLFFTQSFSSTMAPLIQLLGRDMTFTGRTDIWQNVLANKAVNPIIGTGYFTFWGTEGGMQVRGAMKTPGLHSSHNGYVDIYVDGGVIGLCFLVGFLLTRGGLLIRIIRSNIGRRMSVDRFALVRFAFLVVIIIYNLGESTFARLAISWFTAVTMLIELPVLKRTREAEIARPLCTVQPS